MACVADVDPARQKWPAAQGAVQADVVSPVVEPYVPAGHAVGAPAPAGQKRPIGHVTGAACAPAQELPAGHGPQTVPPSFQLKPLETPTTHLRSHCRVVADVGYLPATQLIVYVLYLLDDEKTLQPLGCPPDHEPVPPVPKYCPHVPEVARARAAPSLTAAAPLLAAAAASAAAAPPAAAATAPPSLTT